MMRLKFHWAFPSEFSPFGVAVRPLPARFLTVVCASLAVSHTASASSPTLQPFAFPALVDAFVPLEEGDTLFPSGRASLPYSFAEGNTVAWVRCVAGARFDVAVPRGASLAILEQGLSSPPEVLAGDGTGLFATAPLTARRGLRLWTPTHPSQRHALVVCPGRAAASALTSATNTASLVGVRVLVKAGRDAPRASGALFEDASKATVSVRREKGLVWESYQRLQVGEPLRLEVPSGRRALVRVRPLFGAGAVTTGWARFRLQADAAPSSSKKTQSVSQVEFRSAWEPTSRKLADGSSPGEERMALLSTPAPATSRVESQSRGVTLSCTQECLVRVEEIAASQVSDDAVAGGVALALSRQPLSYRTLPPEAVESSLTLHALTAKYQEPLLKGDDAPSDAWGDSPTGVLEALHEADLYASPRRLETLIFEGTSDARAREIRISVFAPSGLRPRAASGATALESAPERREFRLIAESGRLGAETLGKTQTAAPLRLLWEPSLALPASKRQASLVPSGLDAESGAGESMGFRRAFASRVILPWSSSLARVRLEPVTPQGRARAVSTASQGSSPVELAFSVSLGVPPGALSPVSTSRLFEARLEKMKAHFSAVARTRKGVSSLRAGGLPKDLDAHVALERRLERARAANDVAAVRSIFEERQDALTSSGHFALGRSLLWEFALTQGPSSMACDAARVLARVSEERSEFHTAAMAWFAAYRSCASNADLASVRVALLRQGAFASAREFEPALDAAGALAPDDRAADIARFAAYRDANPRALQALLSAPALAKVPHVHLPVENALREASGFLVTQNEETGVEERRVSSSSVAPSVWQLAPGRVYVVTWRRVLPPSGSPLDDAWLKVSPLDGARDDALFLPLESCEEGDKALVQAKDATLCAEDAFVLKIPSHWKSLVALRPLQGHVGVSLRERLAGQQSADLSERERQLLDFARLVGRKETQPALSASLVAEGDAFFRAAQEPGALKGLHARLLRGRTWKPVQENLLHAGVWKEDAASSAWPLSADDRVARLHDILRGVVELDGRDYRLGPTNRLAFHGGNGGSGVMRIRLKSDGTAPLERQRVRVLRNGRPDTVLALSDSRSVARLALPSATSEDVLALELEDHVVGQSVFVTLPTTARSGGAIGKGGPAWREPDERTWFAATPSQPVKTMLPGPGRLRVEERLGVGLPTRERFQTLRAGWNTVEVRPEGSAQRSYVRLSVLDEAPGALAPRPRGDAWAVEGLARSGVDLAALSGMDATSGMAPPPPRLTWGESREVSWRLVSDAAVSTRPEGELLPAGERRVTSSIGVVRKEVIERWALYSSSSASVVGVRGRMPVASLGQKFTFAPDSALFRYTVSGDGFFQRPYTNDDRTEWSALMRHEVGLPLSFPKGGGWGVQAMPRFGFFYRWWSLEDEKESARYPNGEVDTLVSNGFFRAHPYGAFVGARLQVAPFTTLPSRVLFDVESVSGPDVEPLDPARLEGSVRYVQLVGDFDVEGFGEWERTRGAKDASTFTRDSRTSTRAGGALRYVHHRRGARLVEVGARGGHDFQREAPFVTAALTWHLSADALFRHDAPDELLMREERIRRARPADVPAASRVAMGGGLSR